MIHRKKRTVSERRMILNSFSVKKRKALKCDPSLITFIETIKRKIEEIATKKRFEFFYNPSEVANHEQ